MANDIGGVWRTVGGRRIFIKNGQDLQSAMKESGKFNTKTTTFEDIDADTKEEFVKKQKEYIDKNLNIETSDLNNNFYRQKATLDDKIVGTIDYELENDYIKITYVSTKEDYRRLGIGTKMYQNLQKNYPNKEINFGNFTPEGEKLVRKIGNVEKRSDGKYWGKIKI